MLIPASALGHVQNLKHASAPGGLTARSCERDDRHRHVRLQEQQLERDWDHLGSDAVFDQGGHHAADPGLREHRHVCHRHVHPQGQHGRPDDVRECGLHGPCQGACGRSLQRHRPDGRRRQDGHDNEHHAGVGQGVGHPADHRAGGGEQHLQCGGAAGQRHADGDHHLLVHVLQHVRARQRVVGPGQQHVARLNGPAPERPDRQGHDGDLHVHAHGHRGVTTSDTFTFNVTVMPLAVSAQAGTAATTAAGATLAQGTALASGIKAKTPSIVTTVTPAAGADVQLVANGTPPAAVSYKCASSNGSVLADVTVSVSTTTAVGLTFGAAADVFTATTVTFTCALTANAGGLTTADSFTFEVTVVPLMVDVYPSAVLAAADGHTGLSTSTKISSGGSLAKTVQLYAGVTYAAGSTVALKVNVAPTAAVSYVCTSSNKTVIGDVAATSVSTTAAVNLALPTPAVVSAGTFVTFTCAPSAAASGFATTVSVTFDVYVSNPTAQVMAGSAAGTAADGTTTLTAGASIFGSGIASRTPVVYEGAAASSTIVALQATAPPQTATTYSCLGISTTCPSRPPAPWDSWSRSPRPSLLTPR